MMEFFLKICSFLIEHHLIIILIIFIVSGWEWKKLEKRIKKIEKHLGIEKKK